MIRVVAILETMWDWRQMTSGAGYSEAPRYFRINSENYSGKRLYKLIGPDAKLLVTNACRELVSGPQHHGKGDPVWLEENLRILDSHFVEHGAAVKKPIDVLLICGKVAAKTFLRQDYRPAAWTLFMPHPAARAFWTKETIHQHIELIRTRPAGTHGGA